MKPEILILPNPQILYLEAASRFVAIARESIAERGSFFVALSGGNTPQGLHRLLATPEFSAKIDWTKVRIFFGDERAVPPDHPDSNYRAATENLLSKVSIPPENIHRMPAERSDLSKAADDYEKEIRNVFRAEKSIPVFDLILLGLGDDGHTASLFPGTPALEEKVKLVVENQAPKTGSGRLTFTYPLINRASRILFLVEGKNKKSALERIFSPPSSEPVLPAARVHPENGTLSFLLDSSSSPSRLP